MHSMPMTMFSASFNAKNKLIKQYGDISHYFMGIK